MTSVVDHAPAASRRRLPRPTLFVAVGVALALSTVAGYGWELAEWFSMVDRGEIGDRAEDQSVRLGHAGLIAAAIGWAAFARSMPRAAVRVPAALVLTPTAVILAVWAAHKIASTIEDWLAPDEFQPVAEVVLQSWVVAPNWGVIIGVSLVGVSFLGPVAKAAATETGAAGRALAGLLVSLVLLDGVASLSAGAQVAALLAVASAAWLLWALRRARSGNVVPALTD